MKRFIGIDFSGDHKKWKANCGGSNVWIAQVSNHDGLKLEELFRVQELPGEEEPFQRLVDFLQQHHFAAVAIDAPFSVPRQFVGYGGHKGLLERVRKIGREGRPFPSGADFFRAVTGQTGRLDPCKPLRCTEELWNRKVNVRSSLWNGPRGGAPMTAACLTLLAEAEGAIWPWVQPNLDNLFVEAFPAAQLQTWRLPFKGYGKHTSADRQNRHCIVEHLEVIAHGALRSKMIESADALDAVVAAFAGIAVKENHLLDAPQGASSQGWIAVHKCKAGVTE